MKKCKEKLCLFDIETTPNIILSWGTGKQYVTYDQIIKEWKVSCIAAKLDKQSKVYTWKMNMSKHDLGAYDDDADRKMLESFIDFYNSCDAAIAHNGAKFDIPKMRARLVKFGLVDFDPIILDDTYLGSKKIKFNSHRLDYIGKYLNIGSKINVNYQLWKDVMDGSKEALSNQIKYCIGDVKLLQKVLNKLRPYLKLKQNSAIFNENINKCPKPNCSGELGRGLIRQTVSLGKRVQFRCKICGAAVTRGYNEIKNSGKYPR